MKDFPSWLPHMISIDGEWTKVLALLYGIFEKDFKQMQRFFEGRPIWWDRRVLGNEKYEEGFWHLITVTHVKTGQRLLEPRRAERLPWCGPTISNSNDGAVKVWDYREAKGHVRTYLWLEYWDYVVILEKRKQQKGEIAFLITAFLVDWDSSRRNLKGKFSRREL